MVNTSADTFTLGAPVQSLPGQDPGPVQGLDRPTIAGATDTPESPKNSKTLLDSKAQLDEAKPRDQVQVNGDS